MPSRNRSREAAKAAASPTGNGSRQETKNRKKRKAGGRERTTKGRNSKDGPGTGDAATTARPRRGPMLDPSAADGATTRFVQPYEATKTYICPGCNRDIPPGLGHLVAVPPDDPDLRRHWHRGCWNNRHTRF